MKFLSILAVAILLFVFSFFTERPEPREKTPEPTSTSEVIDDKPNEASIFTSEEEFLEYMINGRAEATAKYGEIDSRSYFMHTHYYKLKNPPPDLPLLNIVSAFGITLTYGTQSDEDERIVIRYDPNRSFDIETDMFWVQQSELFESHIREIDGITYYIAKVDKWDDEAWPWDVQWYNTDGCYMRAYFPYRFTADEVLGYVSDLERVEIG
jgi:hypothetical protein